MPKKKSNQQKQPDNPQEKMSQAVNCVPADNQNQNHNAKKVGMGPNTNR